MYTGHRASYTVVVEPMLLPSGNPIECHDDEVLFLQQIIPPKRFGIPPPLRRSRCMYSDFFFKQSHEEFLLTLCMFPPKRLFIFFYTFFFILYGIISPTVIVNHADDNIIDRSILKVCWVSP